MDAADAECRQKIVSRTEPVGLSCFWDRLVAVVPNSQERQPAQARTRMAFLIVDIEQGTTRGGPVFFCFSVSFASAAERRQVLSRGAD